MSNNIGTSFSVSANGTKKWSSGGIGGLSILIKGVGNPIYYNNNPYNGVYLGGGIKGRMPQSNYNQDKNNPFVRTRFTLKEAWNTDYFYKNASIKKRIITPFRAVNNAGDILSRDNYSCGGNCQSFQSRPNVKGLKKHFGNVSSSCIPSVYYNYLQILPNIAPPAACNVKYVYDGSDYTTYLKQKAINKNYNDLSFGGNNSSTSQSVIRSIRRY